MIRREFNERGRRPGGGFTLIELLTVVAVLGVLFTLTTAAMARARTRAHETGCLSNLRQIVVASEMYADENRRRPRSLSRLAARPGALEDGRPLVCAADPGPREARRRDHGATNRPPAGWGNRANASQQPMWALQQRDSEGLTFDAELRETEETREFSPLHAFAWRRPAWDKLAAAGGAAGVAICQLHGVALRRPIPGHDSYRDYEGKTLRAQRDGAVVRRRILHPDGAGPGTREMDEYPWDLYLDVPPPATRH